MCFATPNVSPILGRFVKPPRAAEMAISGGSLLLLGSPSCEARLPQNPTRWTVKP